MVLRDAPGRSLGLGIPLVDTDAAAEADGPGVADAAGSTVGLALAVWPAVAVGPAVSTGLALGPGVALAVEDVVGLQDYTGELHDVDVTIGLLRHFLMHSPHASVNPAVAASVKGYLKVNEARLRSLQRGIMRPWRRVAGKRFRSVLARAVTAL